METQGKKALSKNQKKRANQNQRQKEAKELANVTGVNDDMVKAIQKQNEIYNVDEVLTQNTKFV